MSFNLNFFKKEKIEEKKLSLEEITEKIEKLSKEIETLSKGKKKEDLERKKMDLEKLEWNFRYGEEKINVNPKDSVNTEKTEKNKKEDFIKEITEKKESEAKQPPSLTNKETIILKKIQDAQTEIKRKEKEQQDTAKKIIKFIKDKEEKKEETPKIKGLLDEHKRMPWEDLQNGEELSQSQIDELLAKDRKEKEIEKKKEDEQERKDRENQIIEERKKEEGEFINELNFIKNLDAIDSNIKETKNKESNIDDENLKNIVTNVLTEEYRNPENTKPKEDINDPNLWKKEKAEEVDFIDVENEEIQKEPLNPEPGPEAESLDSDLKLEIEEELPPAPDEKETKEIFDKLSEKDKEETILERKFDTKKVAEEIKQKIAERELESGAPLSLEQKQELARDMFLKSKEDFQKETIESHKFLRHPLEKTQKWWQDLEKTRWGKTLKIGTSAAFIGGATLLAGARLGLGVPSSASKIAYKISSRVVMATGMNMALTSNLSSKTLGLFKKETNVEKSAEEIEEEGKFKKVAKFLTSKNGMMALSIGMSAGSAFILSGGLSVFAVGATGIVLKRISNHIFDKKIKEAEEKIKNLSGKIKSEGLGDGFNIENLAKNLETIGKDYDDVAKSMKMSKWGKDIMNGALTIGVGLGTMAAMSHNQLEARTKNSGNNKQNYTDIEKQKLESEMKAKQEAELEKQNKLKQEIEKQIKNATIKGGEGYQNSFIRQIEGNKGELAIKLGFKGDINDTKALHEFAGKQAHIISTNTGIVGEEGKETWVTEGNKIAPVLKMEDGKIIVEIKNTENGEQIETLQKGSKFGENLNKYEKIHAETPHETTTKEISQQDHIEAEAKENGIVLNEKKIDPMRINSDDIEIKDGHSKDHIIEYDDTSKPTGANKDEINFSADDKTREMNELFVLKNTTGKDYTEPVWAKAPENVYNISLDQLDEVSRVNIHNLHTLKNNKSLNLLEKDELDSVLRDGDASAMIGLKPGEVAKPYQKLCEYVNKLYEETKLEPKAQTLLTPAETNENYIFRALMNLIKMRKLDKVKL